MTTDAVHASPTKRFFVDMLTRDIELDDAILDLLDNCVDGVLRRYRPEGDATSPYREFFAQLTFDKTGFQIEDNCGGIPRKLAVESAFMLGRPATHHSSTTTDLPTVGVYGVGMTRAIFKMGKSAVVTSVTSDDAFSVSISPAWLKDDHLWELPLKDASRDGLLEGTTIHVTQLHEAIAARFMSTEFEERLLEKIENHYSYLMHKGFHVFVNETEAVPKPLTLLYREPIDNATALAPYLYQGKRDGVTIAIFVGLYRAVPSSAEAEEEQAYRHSRDAAGWTVICNDRVVVYCDKTRLTGWGEAGVPSFHPQFNAIAGVVQFQCSDVLRLPITTTKRGIDASSDLYLFAKDFMREGAKLFTNYTNKWKELPEQEKANARGAKALPLEELGKKIPRTEWTSVRGQPGARRYLPSLPVPASARQEKVVRFSRPSSEIERVSNLLFADATHSPSEVGAAAFDRALAKT